jgi:eukaryotic-like serine/threonine-protein kinase
VHRTLGRYRLIAELARGGMGTVYLAALNGPARFSKVMVIKQLRPAFAEDANFTAMFLEEARLAARLHHPNIVQTNEVVCHPEDGYFMVMEYLEGASLRRVLSRLRKQGDEPARSIYLRTILDVLTALQYAHSLKDFDGASMNLVHRDVNPSNVVIVFDGQVKLLDFGIAKAADSGQETQAGIVKGKLHYMSPEQMAGDRLDSRADVFAVGAMLWDALAGRKLWEGLKGLDVMTSLAKGAIDSPRSVNPNIAEELERICMRALAVFPDDRYPDAASFRDDLERALGGADPMPTADIAAALAAEFGEEREHVRSLIAEQMHSVEQMPVGAIPSLASQTPPPFTNSVVSDKTLQTPSALTAQTEDQAIDRPFGRARRLSRGTSALLTICGLGAVVGIAAWLSWGSGASSSATRAPDWTQTRGAASMASAATTAEASDRAAPSIAPSEPAALAAPELATETRARIRAARGRIGRSHAAAPAATGNSLGLRDTAPDRGADGAPAPLSVAPAPAPRPAAAEVGVAPAPAPSEPLIAPAVIAAPTAVPVGTIAADAVRAVVRSHAGEIQRCFERAQMDQLYLSARITMSATVAPDGRVAGVSTSSSRDGTARLQACIQTAVQGWTFPPPAGAAAAHVSYTFVFE